MMTLSRSFLKSVCRKTDHKLSQYFAAFSLHISMRLIKADRALRTNSEDKKSSGID